jgi:hypothetical protein
MLEWRDNDPSHLCRNLRTVVLMGHPLKEAVLECREEAKMQSSVSADENADLSEWRWLGLIEVILIAREPWKA